MFSSATGTLGSGFPVRTFPGVVKLGTKPAFSLQSAQGGFVSESLAAKALGHCLSFFQIFDLHSKMKSCQVQELVSSLGGFIRSQHPYWDGVLSRSHLTYVMCVDFKFVKSSLDSFSVS